MSSLSSPPEAKCRRDGWSTRASGEERERARATPTPACPPPSPHRPGQREGDTRADACDSGDRRAPPAPRPRASPPGKGHGVAALRRPQTLARASPLPHPPSRPAGEGPRRGSGGGRDAPRPGGAARGAPPSPSRASAPPHGGRRRPLVRPRTGAGAEDTPPPAHLLCQIEYLGVQVSNKAEATAFFVPISQDLSILPRSYDTIFLLTPPSPKHLITHHHSGERDSSSGPRFQTVSQATSHAY